MTINEKTKAENVWLSKPRPRIKMCDYQDQDQDWRDLSLKCSACKGFIILGRKHISKKFWVWQKNSTKIWCPKKSLVIKKFWVWKNFVSEKILVWHFFLNQSDFWVQENFGSGKKNLRFKNIFDWIVFGWVTDWECTIFAVNVFCAFIKSADNLGMDILLWFVGTSCLNDRANNWRPK